MKKEILGEAWLQSHRPADPTGPDDLRAEIRSLRPSSRWNPENFARQQIRGLVRTGIFLERGPTGAAGGL
jgi:hypothetical protein